MCALLTLLLLASCLWAQAEAAVWDFDDEAFKVKGYQGEGGAVVVPAEIDACTVDVLGMYLFNADDTLTSLALPTTLRQVEDSSVAFCNNLTEVIIPEGVQVIGDNCRRRPNPCARRLV